jgi:hypothetical protein
MTRARRAMRGQYHGRNVKGTYKGIGIMSLYPQGLGGS